MLYTAKNNWTEKWWKEHRTDIKVLQLTREFWFHFFCKLYALEGGNESYKVFSQENSFNYYIVIYQKPLGVLVIMFCMFWDLRLEKGTINY